MVTNQTFDQNGNLAETQTVNGATYTTYQFDGAERLTQITKYAFNGVFVARSSFIYDGFGRRKEDIEQTFSGSTNTNGAWTTTSDVLFVYDGMNVIEELDSRYTSRPLLAYNVWAGTQGGLLSRATFQYFNGTLLPADNATSYYSYDGRGNVTQLTNSAGSIGVSLFWCVGEFPYLCKRPSDSYNGP